MSRKPCTQRVCFQNFLPGSLPYRCYGVIVGDHVTYSPVRAKKGFQESWKSIQDSSFSGRRRKGTNFWEVKHSIHLGENEPQPRQINDRLYDLMPPLERVYDGSGDSVRNNVQQAISDFFSRAPRNENDIIVLNREI